MTQTQPARLSGATSGAILISPDLANMTETDHGLLIDELINTSPTGNTPDGPMSAGVVLIPPNGKTRTHVHPKHWAYVIVLHCGAEGAVTQLGSTMSETIVQFAWQIVRIEPGVEHRAHNPSANDWVAAVELTNSTSVLDGRELLPHLDSIPLPRLQIPPRPVFQFPPVPADRGTL